MCNHQLLHIAAICPVCAQTAVEIALGFLQKRNIPVLKVNLAGVSPVIDIDDFENRTGKQWTRYSWGVDARGRWEKHVAKLGGCRLRRTLRVLPIRGITCYADPAIGKGVAA